MAKVKERTMHIVFLVAACMSILAVAMICLFMFAMVFQPFARLDL